MEQVIAFAEYLVKALVQYPEDIEITTFKRADENSNGEVDVISVRVNEADIGVCIGREGKHSDMLRTFVCVYGYKMTDNPVYFEIDTSNSHSKKKSH